MILAHVAGVPEEETLTFALGSRRASASGLVATANPRRGAAREPHRHGSSVTTSMLGHTFASLGGDRVIALDGNPDAGSLAYRVRRDTTNTIMSLLARREQIERYGVRPKSQLEPDRVQDHFAARCPSRRAGCRGTRTSTPARRTRSSGCGGARNAYLELAASWASAAQAT